MAKRVWILGAGFSRSLGAPLLDDLLSFRLRSRLVQNGFEPLDLIYALYHYGMDFPEGYAFEPGRPTPPGEKGLWRNAEHFLEFLDQCASEGEIGAKRLDVIAKRLQSSCGAFDASAPRQSSHARVNPTLKAQAQIPLVPVNVLEGQDNDSYNPKHLLDEAKRIIAAEVCEFLERASPERFKPYIRWLKNLGRDDTIITFNYDCLIEVLAESEGKKIHIQQLQPGPPPKHFDAPRLMKLHGSVNWQKANPQLPFGFRLASEWDYATKHPEEGQICTPGGSKLESSQGVLEPLWRDAAQAIEDADLVHFIGYRLPESDAAAREMILDALSKRQRHIVIILGPPSFDRSRLSLMVRMIAGSSNDLDLTAEDYLQIWSTQREQEKRRA